MADDFALMMLEETLTEPIFSMDGDGLRKKSTACTGRVGNAPASTGGDPSGSASASMPNTSFGELLQCSPNKSLSDHSITYLSNVVEDSEGTQRKAMEKGTYFKTGLYNPLKKELNGYVSTNHNASDGLFGVGMRPSLEPESMFNQPPVFSKPPPEIATVVSTDILPATTILQHLSCLDLGTSVVGNSGKCSYNTRTTAYATTITAPDVKHLEQKEQLHQLNSRSVVNAGRVDTRFMDLLSKICCVSEAEYFFVEQFTKNYVS